MKSSFNPKLFSLLRSGIDKRQIGSDITAGIVVGIVALPLAIAFAVASGVSPEKGIITAIVAGFIISFLGGSRVQIGGPTGAFIVIVYGIVEQYGLNGLFISTVMAGIILVIFGILKLGSLLKYIPHPLIIGFTSGIALVIFSTQIKDALGFDIDKLPSDFIGKWKIYFSEIGNINIYALAITIITILITVFSKKFIKKIPGSFISIILITVIVKFFSLPVFTIESFFGEIPNSFSIVLPSFKLGDLSMYLKPAFTIAMLGAIESLLSAVVSDGMIGGNHRSNTELVAQGIANIVAPFFGGIPATGAIARTATNVNIGGRTPIAGIIHAITLLLIMLFLGPLAKLIPMPCLAGILIVVAFNMSEWRSFKSILLGTHLDSIVLISTFLLTVFVDLSIAIEVGVVLSSLIFMKRMASSWNISNKENVTDFIENYKDIPQNVLIYEISGPLFFATAKEYTEVIKSAGLECDQMIIRMRHVPFIDSTGLHNLSDVIRILKNSKVEVLLCELNKSSKDSITKHAVINTEHIFNSFDDALDYMNKD